MTTKKVPKSSKFFECKQCDYITSRKSQFDRHLLTAKHQSWNQILQNTTNLVPQITKQYSCKFCNKEYKHHSSLWNHQKVCFKNNNLINETINDISNNEITTLTNLVLNVFKQNQDLVMQNNNLQKQIIEVCKNSNTTNNSFNNSINITNSNLTSNKTFNLNLFLNEKCKDAMNISDFVDTLNLQLTDLESVGKMGFVDGIANIIVKNLKALDIYKRPVHCSDTKREILYVKDENKWEKEDDDKIKLKRAIKHIAHKNTKLIPEWREKNPDCINSDSKKSDQYNNIIIEAMGGLNNEDNEFTENKIIKRIAKEVIIEKEQI